MSAKILFFGDVHFYSNKEYFIDAGDMFIEHVKNHKDNNSNNVAIFLGDLVENFVNDGIVMDQLHRLSECLKFKKTYVLVGNHDIKKNKAGIEHISYEFYNNLRNIQVIYSPTQIEIEGHRCLALPHYNPRPDLPPMYDYYSNLPEKFTSQEYDFVIGHFTDSSLEAFGKTVDLSKIRTKKIILGHIHVRSNERYIGSIFALNPVQNATNRAIWVLHDNKWTEDPLPDFIHFYDVTFPDPLPSERENCKIPVFTIYNCNDSADADRIYGKVWIRQLNLKQKSLNPILQKEADFKATAKFTNTGNYNDVLTELVKASKGTYDRGAVSILREIFGSSGLRTR